MIKRTKQYIGIIGGIVVIALVAYGTWQFSKSRTYQLFGTLIAHIDTEEMVVALSFDDGPDPEYVDQVINTLSRYSATATFFLTGNELTKNPDSGCKLIVAGHEIGNHTWSHRQLIMTNMRTIVSEIETTDAEIIKTGQTQPILFRPPYGKKLFLLPFYLMKKNRTTVLWDAEPDSLPSQQNDAELIYKNAISSVKPGSIILMHVLTTSRTASRMALPMILESLQEKGYKVVTVGQLLSRSEVTAQ